MTGRILNRQKLREQADQAEQMEAVASDLTVAVDPGKKGAKGKTAAAVKVRKPRKVKAPPRMRARWGLFDAGMKQVAIFDYSQRAAADEKLADLLSKKKGLHFLQIVKDAMPEPAPAEAPLLA
jgi:hypothetical protein